VRVRELGLPRDALLNLIVRDGGGLLPRGSTRVAPGDRLHVIARQEIAVELRDLLKRWREGPLGPVARPQPTLVGSPRPVWTGPWREADGDPGRPEQVRGTDVIDQIRTRRDGTPGAVVLLADGRYAVTGPVAAEVIGALAAPEDPRVSR
jgi:cell volume regulation protein A